MTESVQIAGRSCADCGKRIVSDDHGIPCLRCEVVFCNDCASSECPKCHSNFAQQEVEYEAREREDAVIRRKQGGRRKPVVTAILIALPVIPLIVSFLLAYYQEEPLEIYEELRPFGLIFLLIGCSIYYCANWARDFFLYRWAAQWEVRRRGETLAHFRYALFGLSLIGAGVLILAAELQ